MIVEAAFSPALLLKVGKHDLQRLLSFETQRFAHVKIENCGFKNEIVPRLQLL
jgi:hypothetical protein